MTDTDGTIQDIPNTKAVISVNVPEAIHKRIGDVTAELLVTERAQVQFIVAIIHSKPKRRSATMPISRTFNSSNIMRTCGAPIRTHTPNGISTISVAVNIKTWQRLQPQPLKNVPENRVVSRCILAAAPLRTMTGII